MLGKGLASLAAECVDRFFFIAFFHSQTAYNVLKFREKRERETGNRCDSCWPPTNKHTQSVIASLPSMVKTPPVTTTSTTNRALAVSPLFTLLWWWLTILNLRGKKTSTSSTGDLIQMFPTYALFLSIFFPVSDAQIKTRWRHHQLSVEEEKKFRRVLN